MLEAMLEISGNIMNLTMLPVPTNLCHIGDFQIQNQ